MKLFLILLSSLLAVVGLAGVTVTSKVEYSNDGVFWADAGLELINSFPGTNSGFFIASAQVQTSSNAPPATEWVTLTVWTGPTLDSMTNIAVDVAHTPVQFTAALIGANYYRPVISIIGQVP